MNFSVIYSFDCIKSCRVRDFLPRFSIRRHMTQTEGDEQYDLNHLGGDWENGKHRKLAGLLTRKQFEQFLEDTDLRADSVETMGSLGAPGCGFGCAPAISFDGFEDDCCLINAYVTPIPDFDRKVHPPEFMEKFESRSWRRIKTAILKRWGTHRSYESYQQQLKREAGRESS